MHYPRLENLDRMSCRAAVIAQLALPNPPASSSPRTQDVRPRYRRSSVFRRHAEQYSDVSPVSARRPSSPHGWSGRQARQNWVGLRSAPAGVPSLAAPSVVRPFRLRRVFCLRTFVADSWHNGQRPTVPPSALPATCAGAAVSFAGTTPRDIVACLRRSDVSVFFISRFLPPPSPVAFSSASVGPVLRFCLSPAGLVSRSYAPASLLGIARRARGFLEW